MPPPAPLNSLRPNLGKALSAAQTKMSDFLRSGPRAERVYEQAGQYIRASVPKVRSTAFAVRSRAKGLMENFESIETDAVRKLQDGNALYSFMRTDPSWVNLLVSNWEVYSGRTLEVLTTKVWSAVNLTKDLWAIKKDLDTHTTQILFLERDSRSLEAFAQGKGFRAVTERVTGFYGQTINRVATIGAVAVAAYLVLPGILARTAMRRRQV